VCSDNTTRREKTRSERWSWNMFRVVLRVIVKRVKVSIFWLKSIFKKALFRPKTSFLGQKFIHRKTSKPPPRARKQQQQQQQQQQQHTLRRKKSSRTHTHSVLLVSDEEEEKRSAMGCCPNCGATRTAPVRLEFVFFSPRNELFFCLNLHQERARARERDCVFV
jgi:hypothetical protein